VHIKGFITVKNEHFSTSFRDFTIESKVCLLVPLPCIFWSWIHGFKSICYIFSELETTTFLENNIAFCSGVPGNVPFAQVTQVWSLKLNVNSYSRILCLKHWKDEKSWNSTIPKIISFAKQRPSLTLQSTKPHSTNVCIVRWTLYVFMNFDVGHIFYPKVGVTWASIAS